MSTTVVIVIVVVFVVMDLAVVGAVLHMAGGSLRELSQKFPVGEPGPSAVRREFQSFRFGVVNLSWSVHVIADERHLHLRGAWITRTLMGFRGASVAWEHVRDVRVKRAGAKYATCTIGSVEVMGPAWCLTLARMPEA